jgi:ABC-2 type transport system permease protein
VPTALALCEELFNTLMLVTCYPQHPFALPVRIVLFTVFPAAFAAFVPAEVVRHPDGGGVLLMLAAAGGYSVLAVAVFDRGLKRYRSGNRLLELR